MVPHLKYSECKLCTFCSKALYTFDTCYRREKQTSNVYTVSSNVDSNLGTMRMKVGNVTIDAVFDSGPKCSVMRKSVSNKLPGRRCQAVNYLRGIGPSSIISLSTLTVVCTIDHINVEISLNILPDYEITSDVLIGVNLLQEAELRVIVTKNSAKLFH